MAHMYTLHAIKQLSTQLAIPDFSKDGLYHVAHTCYMPKHYNYIHLVYLAQLYSVVVWPSIIHLSSCCSISSVLAIDTFLHLAQLKSAVRSLGLQYHFFVKCDHW